MRMNLAVAAAVEQIERAQYFLTESRSKSTRIESWRNLIAATYFGRAALELIREAAKQKRLKVSVRDLDVRLAELLPQYNIIKEIRVRDFHRYPVACDSSLRLEGKVSVPPYSTVVLSFRIDPENPALHYLSDSDEVPNSEFFLRSGSKFQDKSMGLPLELDLILEVSAGS